MTTHTPIVDSKPASSTHLLLTWELGSGYGHIMGFIPLIEALIPLGVSLSIIARNTVVAGQLLADYPVTIYPSPIFIGDQDRLRSATLSYSDIIYDLGFGDVDELTHTAQAWQNLFALINPDMIIADHSPTAILAARCKRIPSVTFGTGFFIPPLHQSLPLFQRLADDMNNKVRNKEQQVLHNINTILETHGQQSIDFVSNLFADSLNLLCTLHETDHYGAYRDPEMNEYIGGRFCISQGVTQFYPDGKGKRIFGYLKETAPGFEQIIASLIVLTHHSIVHVPKPSAALRERLADVEHIQLSAQPVRVDCLLDKTDLIICHAGHGLVSAGLLSGTRMLLIPSQLEQSLLTQRLAGQRLVAAINPAQPNVDYIKAIEFALTSSELAQQIEHYVERYAHIEQSGSMHRIAQRCLTFLLDTLSQTSNAN